MKIDIMNTDMAAIEAEQQVSRDRFLDKVAAVAVAAENLPREEGITDEDYRIQSIGSAVTGVLSVLETSTEGFTHQLMESTKQEDGSWNDVQIVSHLTRDYPDRYAHLKLSYLKSE